MNIERLGVSDIDIVQGPRRNSPHDGAEKRTLVIACGALAHEFLAVVRANGWTHMDITCLPAEWHLTPQKIPDGMRRKIRQNREKYDEILCLFGDCGTAGALDEVLRLERVERIEGEHCYAFFTGLAEFDVLHEQEEGTLYLTDFLVRHFDRFVVRHFGLDRFPDLKPMIFGNFERIVYLAQMPSADLEARAQAAATWIGLPLQIHTTGLGELTRFLSRPATASDN
ncbi:DUF1638 domain-containing protein [Komagataeibacter xylinus]|uniref:DUF1638 domain-containing protein n=1 Tax=Komagataeibacter xylinus TaxID=28448 RepID=UPI00280A854D|nr:DUF1638 domain-containing protein [Komagataeibacter xylinus]